MITFESVGDYPNGYSLSDAEFQALFEIMATDELYYDYAVTEAQETAGWRFLVVEKRCPKYEYAHTYYRIDTDGSWGVLFQPAQEAERLGREVYWDQERDEERAEALALGLERSPFGEDTARIIDTRAGGVIAYCHKDNAGLLVRALAKEEL